MKRIKHILSISLILVGIVANGQEMLLKERVNLDWANLDTLSVTKYYYDNEIFLTQIITYYEGGDIGTKNYSNDTLVNWSNGYSYEYFDDSIVVYVNNDIYNVYQLNEANETVKDYNATYTWIDGNLVYEDFSYFSIVWEYYAQYKNPRYNEYKYIKSGDCWSSINMPLNGVIYADENYADFDVLESINDYPTIIKYMSDTWEHGEYIHFYYHNLSDIPDKINEPTEVLMISYFNLLGQKIDKPKHEIYIERKLTNKGVFIRKLYCD